MQEEEEKYIHEAFQLNWIAPVGPHISRFENNLQTYSGSPHVTALNSGTSAIHLALILAGIQEGDEVLASTFTFSATINPILYQKAIPVFVESEKDTWNTSPEYLEEAIVKRIAKGKKPKAFILVHLYGNPANLSKIMEICRKYDILLIEDAAESLGSTYNGQMTGTFGDYGIYSFNGNKIITTSGGGALLTKHKSDADKALYLATQAKGKADFCLHEAIGYNYRMSNIAAAIGLGQMEVLNQRIEKRRQILSLYKKAFQEIPEINFPRELDGATSNCWLSSICWTSKVDPASIRKEMDKEGIETRRLWKPMHTQPIFSDFPYYGDNTSKVLFEKGLSLPSGTALGEKEVSLISEIIRSFF
ncbi:MAG: DegT/DnrJ/EryC1/StrS family aminotransferase [Cytophagaceae bacterium]